MKANKDERHFEVSHESLDMLKNRIEELFQRNELDRPWFPDHYQWEHFKHEQKPQNIVVFGSFVRSFLESGLWPWRESRIWCLSETVKSVFVQQLGLDSQYVSVIPRHLLFKPLPAFKRELGESLSLIYAGRISASKGLILLLEVYKLLDEKSDGACQLQLYGAFDDEYSESFGRRKWEAKFEEYFLGEIKTHEWKKPPCWYGKVSRNDWLKNTREKILISLSNLYVEDFGVSLAQIQEVGGRAIVSGWGGHRDASEVWRIPVEHLELGIENKKLLRLKASLIVNCLEDSFDSTRHSKADLELPKLASSKFLDEKRKEFISKVGLSALWIQRGNIGHFADTKAGGQFFLKYHECFAGGDIEFDTIYLLNDVDTPNENEKEVNAVCEHFYQHRPSSVHFFSIRYAFRKEVLNFILKANSVVLAIDEKQTQQKALEQLKAIREGAIEVII
jgi:hypothetical protein